MPTATIDGQPQELSDADYAALFGPAPVVVSVLPTIPLAMLRQRVERLGLMDDFSAYLFQYPALPTKLFSLEGGVDPTDPSFAAAFTAMQIPQAYQDYILAPASAGVPEAPPDV